MLKPKRLILNTFRNFKKVEIRLGNKITLISGQNGVGKSNILSLIASGSGLSQKAALGSNFQPEFNEFFNIDPSEDYDNYELYIEYTCEGKYALGKKLTFKDDTSTNRGIRIIPRTTNYFSQIKQGDAVNAAKNDYGVGGAARVGIPTIYLSLSRLYPLGENREKVKVKKIRSNNVLNRVDVREKFKTWYNTVIPNAIKDDKSVEVIEKKACPRESMHMNINNTPTLSQSIGQDNVGNIISALVDIYLLSSKPEYAGALLCIDEIDVSLHPDTQINMLKLLDCLSDEYNIQIIVSSHSLTFIKELLKKEHMNSDSYRIAYIKNPMAPYVSKQKSYDLLKADMFGNLNFMKPKVRTYFEDKVGQILFGIFIDAYKDIYAGIAKDPEGQILRNAPDNYKNLNSSILEVKEINDIREYLNEIPVGLGCEELLKLNTADKFFNRVITVLDGDSRLKDSNQKPKIKDFLDKEYVPEIELPNGKKEKLNTRQHDINVCFFPDFFAPESFLYSIIYKLCKEPILYSDFWKSVDMREETALFTTDRVKNLFARLPKDFNNDNLKDIFKEVDSGSEVWKFVLKTEMVKYYFYDYKTVNKLKWFMEKLVEAFNMAYPLTISNRYY
ncbi:AAA family ATPase [Oribacterium parvum]|uniref:AAA family ATPase n=1 Tax=Oribacterium parvum TaxID=1501329 RepID=UPI0028EE5109|nr:AAA family ATPase [Oribacterium parvum]